MISKANLPPTYQPYQELILCSNRLIDGGYLIQIGDALPLIIGKGPTPQIWLQAPIDTLGEKFIPLVSASIAAHPAILVKKEGEKLVVYAGGELILSVRQCNNNKTAEVDQLNLRPIGFDIYGDRHHLSAGGMHMSDNTVTGGGTFLAIAASR